MRRHQAGYRIGVDVTNWQSMSQGQKLQAISKMGLPPWLKASEVVVEIDGKVAKLSKGRGIVQHQQIHPPVKHMVVSFSYPDARGRVTVMSNVVFDAAGNPVPPHILAIMPRPARPAGQADMTVTPQEAGISDGSTSGGTDTSGITYNEYGYAVDASGNPMPGYSPLPTAQPGPNGEAYDTGSGYLDANGNPITVSGAGDGTTTTYSGGSGGGSGVSASQIVQYVSSGLGMTAQMIAQIYNSGNQAAIAQANARIAAYAAQLQQSNDPNSQAALAQTRQLQASLAQQQGQSNMLWLVLGGVVLAGGAYFLLSRGRQKNPVIRDHRGRRRFVSMRHYRHMGR